MAAVLAGLTLSFVLGIPLGSVAGEWFGWRATFGFSGGLALAAAAAIAAVLPPVPGGERAGPRALSIACPAFTDGPRAAKIAPGRPGVVPRPPVAGRSVGQ